MGSFNRERKRILLVEDDEEARDLAELTLTEYTLICARDFNEGLYLAQQRYFDLYILDNWLSDGSGVELCRLIRKFDPHTPVLFYSAAAYKRDIGEALRAGAQAYLVKPIFPGDLMRAAARLTSVPPEMAFEARRAELAAIREELATQKTENAELLDEAKEIRRRAYEKAPRLKAEMAFLAAGGTRGEFARRWPSVFTEEVRGVRSSGAAGD